MARKVKDQAKGGSTIIRFATNRARLDEAFGMDCALAEASRLWLGQVEVELLGKPEATEAGRDLMRLPDITGLDDFADPNSGPCTKVLEEWLEEAAAGGGVALLFIHGFSNSFGSAVTRAAQLLEFYGGAAVKLVPLVFSWPSDGRVIKPNARGQLLGGAIDQYRMDQRDAANAGPALARLLAEIRRAKARRAGKPPRMALLAHSMGSHALANGLLSLANGLMTREMRDLFADAVLASADVSSAAFEAGKSLRLVADLAERVTIGISFDSTLSVASEIANGNTRLGHVGPDDLAALPANMQVVDYWPGLSWATQGVVLAEGGTEFDVVQHQWYRNDLAARADLAAVLSGGKPPRRKALPAARQQESGRRRHAILMPEGSEA
jgi:pimeloyl-ACP methyl ester carboxylesterase